MKIHLLMRGSLNDISGGYIYNRELTAALTANGFSIIVHNITSTTEMQQTLMNTTPGSWVIIDSIIADDFARVYDPSLQPLVIVYLCHLPLGLRPVLTGGERKSLTATPPDLLLSREEARHLSETSAQSGVKHPPLIRGEMGRSLSLPFATSSTNEEQSHLSTLENKILKHAQLVICTSEFTRSYLTRHSGSTSTQYLTVLPTVSPVFTPAQHTKQHSAGIINLLCVANILPAKGQLAVLEALCALPEQSWHLHLVAGSAICDKDYLAKIREAIQANEIQAQVSLKFDYAGTELVREYQQADVFVLATRFETYGMALAEARACALPTIVNDVGGVRESTYAPSTRYVDPHSAQDLQHALQRCITDRQYLQSLRNEALAGLKQKRSADNNTKLSAKPDPHNWDNGIKHLCEALSC